MIGGYSAYSKITYELCTRLVKMGHRVAHLPMGLSNRMSVQQHEGVLVYKSGKDPWNEDVVLERYCDFQADMIITLKEPWVFQHTHKYAINFTPYAIIDHSPVSPSITSRLSSAFRVIVPSRFAQRELRNAQIGNVAYIPHGVRTDIYKQLEGEKEKYKKLWFIEEDDFTVLTVAMNRSRKMIPQMLKGYKRFLELNPDVKSHMLLWTDVTGGRQSYHDGPIALGVSDVGVNLVPELLNLELGMNVNWPDKKTIDAGIPEWSGEEHGWDMVKMYNAADAFFLCSGGEAAGLPYLEALACGVTPIGTDYAGAPEYVGPGINVRWNDYVIMNTPGVRRPLADIDKMAEALTKIMNANPEKLARRARRYAERFDWSRVMERYVKPFIDDSELELYPKITKEGLSKWA